MSKRGGGKNNERCKMSTSIFWKKTSIFQLEKERRERKKRKKERNAPIGFPSDLCLVFHHWDDRGDLRVRLFRGEREEHPRGVRVFLRVLGGGGGVAGAADGAVADEDVAVGPDNVAVHGGAVAGVSGPDRGGGRGSDRGRRGHLRERRRGL